jgi:hypothetical protein
MPGGGRIRRLARYLRFCKSEVKALAIVRDSGMVTLAGVEPATCGLGNRRSIHLSYRATERNLFYRSGCGEPTTGSLGFFVQTGRSMGSTPLEIVVSIPRHPKWPRGGKAA